MTRLITNNKRVEQGIRHDLSVYIKENNNGIRDVFDIQIPKFSLEAILTRSSKITAQNIADLFKLGKRRIYVGIVSIKHMRIVSKQ